MKGVKRWYLGVCTLVVFAGLGFSVPKQFNPGVYYFTEKTDLTPLAEIEYYWQRDNAASVAPQDVKIEVDTKDAKKIVYSYVELGNAKQKVHYFATINTKGDWDSLYVDVDQNGAITPKEKVLLQFQNENEGIKYRVVANPVRVLVNYKNTAGNSIYKHLSFDLLLQYHAQSGQVYVMHRTRSWFLSECRFNEGKNNGIPVKVALVDLNSDGVFSEFSQDGLFVDANYNGVFDKGEKAKFSALAEIESPDKKKVQYRNYVFSWPHCLAIVPVSQWEDSAKYEPSDDAQPKAKVQLPKADDGLNLVDINSLIK